MLQGRNILIGSATLGDRHPRTQEEERLSQNISVPLMWHKTNTQEVHYTSLQPLEMGCGSEEGGRQAVIARNPPQGQTGSVLGKHMGDSLSFSSKMRSQIAVLIGCPPSAPESCSHGAGVNTLMLFEMDTRSLMC